MNYHVFFSPAGSTEKVVKHVAQSFPNTVEIDLSSPAVAHYDMNGDDFL